MQNITAFCQMVLVVAFSRCYCRKTLYNSRKNGWFKITVQYDYKKKHSWETILQSMKAFCKTVSKELRLK